MAPHKKEGREVKCFTNAPCECSPTTDFQKHTCTGHGRRMQEDSWSASVKEYERKSSGLRLCHRWVALGIGKMVVRSRLGIVGKEKRVHDPMYTSKLYLQEGRLELGQNYNWWINTSDSFLREGTFGNLLVAWWPCLVSLPHGLRATSPDAGDSVSVRMIRRKTGTEKGFGAANSHAAVHVRASGQQLPDVRGWILLQFFMPLLTNKCKF